MKSGNYIIIGASHGIGAEIFKSLDDCSHVYTYSRTEGPGHWKMWDQSSALEVDHLPEVIDGIVYCPGSINLKPFHMLKEADFLRDLEINFLGAVKVLQAIYPRLKKSPHASVVLFSTVAVQKGMSFHSSIAGAKGAVEGLVRSLAIEWAPNIRVNGIAPSLVKTPLSEKITASTQTLEATIQKHPLKKIGEAKDIAEMAVFLLSNKSSWMTGQIIHLDGGLSVN